MDQHGQSSNSRQDQLAGRAQQPNRMSEADAAVIESLRTNGVSPDEYAANLARLTEFHRMNEIGLQVYARKQAQLVEEGRRAEERLKQINSMLPPQGGRPVPRIQGPPPAAPPHSQSQQNGRIPVQTNPSNPAPHPPVQTPLPRSYAAAPPQVPGAVQKIAPQPQNANAYQQARQHATSANAPSVPHTPQYAVPSTQHSRGNPASGTANFQNAMQAPVSQRNQPQSSRPVAQVTPQPGQVLTLDQLKRVYPQLVKDYGPQNAQKLANAYVTQHKLAGSGATNAGAPQSGPKPSTSMQPTSNGNQGPSQSNPVAQPSTMPPTVPPQVPQHQAYTPHQMYDQNLQPYWRIVPPHPQPYVYPNHYPAHPYQAARQQPIPGTDQFSIHDVHPAAAPSDHYRSESTVQQLPGAQHTPATQQAPAIQQAPTPVPTASSSTHGRPRPQLSPTKSTLAKDILRSLGSATRFSLPTEIPPAPVAESSVGDKRKRRESDVGEQVEDSQATKKPNVVEQDPADAPPGPSSSSLDGALSSVNEQPPQPSHHYHPSPPQILEVRAVQTGTTPNASIDLTGESGTSTPHNVVEQANGPTISVENIFQPTPEIGLQYPERTPTPPLAATIRAVDDDDGVPMNVDEAIERPPVSEIIELPSSSEADDNVSETQAIVGLPPTSEVDDEMSDKQVVEETPDVSIKGTRSPSPGRGGSEPFVRRPGMLEPFEEPPDSQASGSRRHFLTHAPGARRMVSTSGAQRSKEMYVRVPSPPPYVRELQRAEAKRREDSQQKEVETEAVVREASTRLRPRYCQWNGCHAALNSEEALRQHVETHEKEERARGSRTVGCQWKNCDVVTDNLKHHLERHVMSEVYCPIEGCEAHFSRSKKLLKHMRSHGGDEPLRSPTTPFKPQLDGPSGVLPQTLPAYMTATRQATTEPISQDRHQKIGPWVLRRIFGHVNLEALAAHHGSRGRISLRLADRTELPADGADTLAEGLPERPAFRSRRDQYDFLESASYSTPAKCADLDSHTVSRLLHDGVPLVSASPAKSQVYDQDVSRSQEIVTVTSPEKNAVFAHDTTLDGADVDTLIAHIVAASAHVSPERPFGEESQHLPPLDAPDFLKALGEMDADREMAGDAEAVENLL